MVDRKTVVVGMSGGVDSSVAALLLLEQGYNVVGVTMQMWQEDAPGSCGGSAAVDDARRVADMLGIPHQVIDFKDIFREKVIDYFAAEYEAGRTPNPCIACNRFVKWEALLAHSLSIGADYIATGHYARVYRDEATGRFTLMQSPGGKDQSYALYNLTQFQLAHTLMPLWSMTKDEVRTCAAQHNLSVAHKPDSQEICFVPDNDYGGFVESHTGRPGHSGFFVDTAGNRLGMHKGILHYTIGQRKGLGAFGKRVFVSEIRADANEVVLGDNDALFRTRLTANSVNFMAVAPFDGPLRAEGKIRYNQTPSACTIRLDGSTLECEFDTPQRAITPGQAAVFYRNGALLCGGTIR